MKFTYNHIQVEEKDAKIEPAVQVKLEKHPWSKLAQGRTALLEF